VSAADDRGYPRPVCDRARRSPRNTSHANTLLADSGLDWFWEAYAKDTTDRKGTDLLN
jgi:hypothetical protein